MNHKKSGLQQCKPLFLHGQANRVLRERRCFFPQLWYTGERKKKPTGKGLPMQKFDHVLLASDFDNTLVYTQSSASRLRGHMGGMSVPLSRAAWV